MEMDDLLEKPPSLNKALSERFSDSFINISVEIITRADWAEIKLGSGGLGQ